MQIIINLDDLQYFVSIERREDGSGCIPQAQTRSHNVILQQRRVTSWMPIKISADERFELEVYLPLNVGQRRSPEAKLNPFLSIEYAF